VPIVALVGGVAAVIALAVFLWPTVGRSSGRLDVVVAGDGFVDEARQAIERRFRERGLSVSVVSASSLCAAQADVADEVEHGHPSVVVLSFQRAEPDCPDLVGPSTDSAGGTSGTAGSTAAVYDAVLRRLGDARVVLSLQPGAPGTAEAQDQAVAETYEALLAARRASVADPNALLGGVAAPAAMPCEWWDICPPGGWIPVRDAPAGPLTEAGGQRFARVIVGVVP
jgi:hypothetical protein